MRYCLATQTPPFASTERRRIVDALSNAGAVDVSFGAEYCCYRSTTPASDRAVREASSKLAVTDRYLTEPHPVPDWKRLTENRGPFVAMDHYVPFGGTVRSADGTATRATSLEEMALALYARAANRADETFRRNFSRSFSVLSSIRVDRVTNLDEFAAQPLTFERPAIDDSVVVDGVRVPLRDYSTPVLSVVPDGPARGSIRPGVTAKNVVVNSSTPVEGFATIYAPGAPWASKWTQSSRTGYAMIDFSAPVETAVVMEELDEEEAEQEKEQDDVSEFEEARCADEGRVELDEPVVTVETGVETETDRRPYFDNLTATERRDLPLSFVLPLVEQWRTIEAALSSRFRRVAYLPRVSDGVLSFVADSAALGPKPLSDVAESIISYAAIRTV